MESVALVVSSREPLLFGASSSSGATGTHEIIGQKFLSIKLHVTLSKAPKNISKIDYGSSPESLSVLVRGGAILVPTYAAGGVSEPGKHSIETIKHFGKLKKTSKNR